jgi:hypothetical protein
LAIFVSFSFHEVVPSGTTQGYFHLVVKIYVVIVQALRKNIYRMSKLVLGGFHFFCENHWFWFLGQVLKITLVLILFLKTFHSKSRPNFQILEKNLVKQFSRLNGLTKF